MAEALRSAGEVEAAERLDALRRLEIRFSIDLGSLCHRFERRNAADTHPLERTVLDYIATWHRLEDGREEFWVLVDHVRQVRELIEAGELVGKVDPGG